MKHYIIITLFFFSTLANGQNSFSDNGMKVTWSFLDSEIIISMETPTTGWQAIGFNASAGLSGTYLIMGKIKNGKAEVVEHFTESAGDYQSISEYGFPQRAKILEFKEGKKSSYIKFSLPIEASNKYQKVLSKGSKYHMLYAYSLDDDFQHHSIFRSSTKIIL